MAFFCTSLFTPYISCQKTIFSPAMMMTHVIRAHSELAQTLYSIRHGETQGPFLHD